MMRSSDCPPWSSDQSGPAGANGDHAAQLHHVTGHDRASPVNSGAAPGPPPDSRFNRPRSKTARIWPVSDRVQAQSAEFLNPSGYVANGREAAEGRTAASGSFGLVRRADRSRQVRPTGPTHDVDTSAALPARTAPKLCWMPYEGRWRGPTAPKLRCRSSNTGNFGDVVAERRASYGSLSSAAQGLPRRAARSSVQPA